MCKRMTACGRRLAWIIVVVTLGARSAGAQSALSIAPGSLEEPPTTEATGLLAAAHATPLFGAQNLAPFVDCPGCPPRRLGTAYLQATYINVFYGLANLIRGQDTAKITPETWWENMKRGWEWDLDEFTVNQFGHPYQGNNYFTAGRANGLSYWESAALTAFGSGTWEYFGETNQASLNDFINTTLGGIALGEMFHRAAWLVRDTRKTGKARLWSEIGATAIDPVTGFNRFRSGDASKVTEKPPDMVPSQLDSITSAGVSWRHNDADDTSSTDPLLELDLLYGNFEAGRSRQPYDAFGVRLAFGAGSPVSELRVRGRLIGKPLKDDRFQFSIDQGYQYNKNDAYQFGAQSVDFDLSMTRNLTSSTQLYAMGWGGLLILGAVDSIPPPGSVVPDEPGEDAGQGVATGPRFYDYGPGTNFGGVAEIRHGRTNVRLSYEAHQLHVLDGARVNHLLQRARADLRFPVRGRLGIGVTAEYFDRHTYFQQEGVDDADFHFPQLRVAMTWSGS